MAELEIRSYASDLEFRSSKKGHTAAGVVVPYDTEQRIDLELVERFARGAFDHQFRAADKVKFLRDHDRDRLMGKAVQMRNDANGLWVEFFFANTDLGRESYELVRDEVLTDFSVGFYPVYDKRLPSGVVERTRVDLREVSLVHQGAYGDSAMVAAVRNEEQESNLDQIARLLAEWPVLPPVV